MSAIARIPVERATLIGSDGAVVMPLLFVHSSSYSIGNLGGVDARRFDRTSELTEDGSIVFREVAE